jgi:hypothetical protein
MLLASDFDKSKYFKAADIDNEKKFRIKAVTSDVLTDKKGNKENRLIVWFTNDERGLVLNKTNNRTLRGAFGDNTAEWVKHIVVVFKVMASNGEPGLRIRIPPPKQAAATAPTATPPSGNGAAKAQPPAADPDLEPDPKLSVADEMNDSIDF